MSVIIRLQNLPWSANALDIREFFKGLSIPEGGVHIVGGELGDAFIAFSSDEDARLAMQKSGTSLKGIQITLLLSSRTEMQKVIEAARQQAMGMQPFMAPVAPTPSVQPVTPAQPGIQQQFQGAPAIQNQTQRVSHDDQSIYSGRVLQSNQPPQNFPHPYNAQQTPFIPNQLPYSGQKVPGYPPGVLPPPPGGMPHYMYGQTPVGSFPPPSGMPQHIPPMENTSVSANFTAGEQAYNDSPHITPKQQSQKEEEKEKDKQLTSPAVASTSSGSREKREKDNKGRDERKRRSKSRSRSKDRDRRRRHRSRSRSRSRDKSGSRRKRTRSRERDRTRERDRQRDRRDIREGSRSHREKSDRTSHETSLEPKASISENTTGIPGLGDIPDDIPKEGLSIFAQPLSNNPVRTKESPSNNSGWIKASNVPDSKSLNSPLSDSEKKQQKPFLLENPPIIMPSGNTPGAPLLADPPIMKNSPIHTGPYRSPPVDGGFKEPLLQRSNEEGIPHDWTHNDHKFRDDDRGYRNQNSNKITNVDHSKQSLEEEPWDKVNPEREPPFSHRPFSHRDDFGYNRDDDIADPAHNQGPGMHQDRRENMYTTRSFAGGFQSDFSNEYDDRYGRGGYRGRGRRGGFVRDNERGSETACMGEYQDDLPFRDMHPQDFDRSRGGRGFFRGRGGRIPLNSDPPRERRSRTCSVEIRNVPTNASYVAIRDLFSGIFVPNGSIKIIGGERGERIGIALVRFRNTWDAFEAYKRSGGYVLNSRVQVKFIDDVIYEEARDIMEGNREMEHSEPMEITSPCVYVSELPVGCTDHDVAKLFEDFKYEEIVLELEKGSRQPSGGCFVRFISSEEAENALSEMKHPNIDGTPVKVAICSPEDMEAAAKERQKIKIRPPQPQVQPENYRPSEIGTKEHILAITQHLKSAENGSDKNNSDEKSEQVSKNENITTKGGDLLTDSIVIKNVSSDINETSIRDFFSDEGLIPEKVYFNKPDSEGQSDVFVVFPKISDAKHAIKKNLQLLGSTKVMVELISKPSVMLAMGMTFDPRELFLKGHEEKVPDTSDKTHQNNDNFHIKESFGPRKMSPSQYENHMRGRAYNNRYNRNDEPPPGSYRPRQPFNYRRDYDRHPTDRTNFDDRMVRNKNADMPRVSEPPQDFGRPGCVVALANVPYAATTDDILNFFKDFDGLQPENVIRRYDERNRPTSDSRVSLRSPEEAINAMETLNHRYMLGRPIYVKLVN